MNLPLIEYLVSLSSTEKGTLLKGDSRSIRVDGPLRIEVHAGGVQVFKDNGEERWTYWLGDGTKVGTADEGDRIDAYNFLVTITDRTE